MSTASPRQAEAAAARGAPDPEAGRAGTPRLSIQIARDLSELKQHVNTWRDLARRAAEPNFFYEPLFILAAAETLTDLEPLQVVLVYAEGDRRQGRPDELVGLFPFGQTDGSPFGRLERFELYHHLYSYLCTPLIDSRYLGPVVECLLDWIAEVPDGIAVFDLPIMVEQGPVWQAMREGLARRGLPRYRLYRAQRALLRPHASAEAYLRQALGAKKRKELRRQKRRLGELGRLELRRIGPQDNADLWAEQFIKLEVSGWKQYSRHAFAHEPDQARFLRRLFRDTQANRTLMVLALTLDDRPIAFKCSFRSAAQPDSAFAFKIAHDVAYARFSPGILLEIENIRELHEQSPALAWMDSCALPENAMINSLWTERRGLIGVACAAPDLLSRGRLLLRRALKG